MFNKLKIGTKVIILVLCLVTLAVVLILGISNFRNRKVVQENYQETIELITKQHQSEIDNFVDKIDRSTQFIVKQPILINSIPQLTSQTGETPQLGTPLREELRNKVFDDLFEIISPENIYCVNKQGKIVYNHVIPEEIGGQVDNEFKVDKIKINNGKFTSLKSFHHDKGIYSMYSAPLMKKTNQVGSVILMFNTKNILSSLASDSVEFSKTFEIAAYLKEGFDFYEIKGDSIFKRTISESSPIYKSTANLTGFGNGIHKDTTGVKSLVYWYHNPKLGLGIVSKVDYSEIKFQLNDFYLYSIVSGIAIIGITLILTVLFSRLLIYPMLKLKKVLGLVSNGVLPKELKTPLQDEVGEMINIVNNIVTSLKKTAGFATQIGEGNFDTNFSPISNKDTLGQALVNMRASLQQADSRDNLRNWIVTGVAEIGEILRSNDTVEALGDQVLEYICLRTDAVQGGFYVVEESHDNSEPIINLKSSYAFGKKKHLNVSFKFAEGLVGQAAIEKDTIMRTEIPEDYHQITSGLLGDQKPTCIIIVPLMTNEKVYGAMEFAAFQEFNDGQMEFLTEVSDIIARTIFNLIVNENTKRLLEESQRMSSELQLQQSELQQNAIEMEKTQEVLTETNTKLEDQISEVNNAQKRIQALLENASEVITIYEEDGVVRFVSPSVKAILGYAEEDLIGIKDVKFIDEQYKEAFEQMFQQLLKEEDKTVTLQIPYFRKTGDKVWLEATGKNMLKDPAIKGIVINSRDITERRRAEEEERKRGQMQALSENSPDLIVRLGVQGNIFYVNPSIEPLTGKTADSFLNKDIHETGLDESIVKSFVSIRDLVTENKVKQETEIDFPSVYGNRIMHISAMPETDPNGNIETVLLVSHDITERKEIENEIVEKNNKINDSINYAENIQEAILPNTVLVQQTFKESFIYFKPRDVVSGDFPWFFRHEKDVYIAAVDCTGHGVPGAMISLVGYFLLNNIVDEETTKNAGEIITDLDHLVTDTFRQNDDDSKLKDGMDLAFCKINIEDRIVEYAGANRPLYLISADGEFSDVKGDKFPIGGGKAYDNKTDFTNNRLVLNPGDTIFFFSDGFPDQFGGPNNTKFGPRRIRQLISDTHGKPLNEIHQEFDRQFMDWQGDGKQTDDVLLIGLRF